jgi:hypothetical protein
MTHPNGKRLKKAVAVVLPEFEIVWRNPERIQCRRRWEPLQETSNSTLYTVQAESTASGVRRTNSGFFVEMGLHRKKLGLCIGCGSEVRNEGEH